MLQLVPVVREAWRFELNLNRRLVLTVLWLLRNTLIRAETPHMFNHALAWLEDNPPRNILLPRVIQPISDAVTFKKKGYLEKDKKSKKGLLKEKKSSDRAFKAMVYCQNAAESLLLTWQWDETPSQEMSAWLTMAALHTVGSAA